MLDEMDEYIYKECKKCHAMDYDNCSFIEITEAPNGKLIIQPETCDRCNFDLMLSPSNELH